MFFTSGSDRVGKGRDAVFHQGDILALHPKRRKGGVGAGEKTVQTAFPADSLTFESVISRRPGKEMRPERGFKKTIGQGRIDSRPEEGSGHGAGLPDALHGPGQLALGVGRRGQQDRRVGPQHAQHGARVVGMSGDDFTVQFRDNEEAFLPADETRGTATGGERQKGGGGQFTLLGETATVAGTAAGGASMEQD